MVPADAPRVPRARGLAAVAALLSATPLVVSGLLHAAASPLATAAPLEAVLEVEVALAAAILYAVWPAFALARGAARGLAAREVELALLAAVLAPPLALARAHSRLHEGDAGVALTALAGAGVAEAAFLAAVSRSRLPREAVRAVLLGLALSPPALGAFARDLELPAAGTIALLSPASAALSLARGESAVPLLVHAASLLAFVLVAVAAGARAGRARGEGGTAIVALAILGAALALARSEARPDAAPGEPSARDDVVVASRRALLGPRLRPGLPAPLKLTARASGAGFSGFLGVASGDVLYAARVELASSPIDVALAPVRAPFDVVRPVAWRDGEAPCPVDLRDAEALVPLKAWTLLAGYVGEEPAALLGALRRSVDDLAVARLDEGDLDLLPAAAGVLDVVVAGRDLARTDLLQRFVAAGGVVACESDALAQQVGALGAPTRLAGGAVERAVGAGLVLSPPSPGASAAVAARVAARLSARRRLEPEALARALEVAPAPGPGRELARSVAIAALALSLALSLAPAALARSSPRTLGVGAAAFSAAAVLVLSSSAIAPRSRVFAQSFEVLEVPSNGRAAARIELLRLASARRELAQVGLDGGPVPVPLGPSCAGTAILLEDASPELAPGGRARLRFTSGPAPRSFLRRGATLEAPSRVVATRGEGRLTVVNVRGGQRLEGTIVVDRAGVRPIGDLAPGAGATVRLDARPLDFAAWRRRLDASSPGGRARRALLEAVLAGRVLGEGSLVAIAFLEPGEASDLDGLAEPAPRLVRALVVDIP